MFHSARLQLTAWYLVIIMIISGLFSLVIYASIDSELKRIEHTRDERQERYQRRIQPITDEPVFSTEAVDAARNRVVITLMVINAGILIISGGAGYFLAGRTLQPILQALEEQRRFVADASHELRTPLTALRSELEVALRDKHLTLRDAKRLLESNIEEVGHLQSLSEGLLTLAKGQTTKKQYRIAASMLAVFEQAFSKITPLAKQKNITITQNITDAQLFIDTTAIVQLLVIILDNAIKYSPDGSGILVKALVKHTKYRITIRDEGQGIAKEDLPYIFERFYRGDKSRSGDSSGYGLGLSIAKKIITDYSGDIQVHSKKGTIVTIHLPLE